MKHAWREGRERARDRRQDDKTLGVGGGKTRLTTGAEICWKWRTAGRGRAVGACPEALAMLCIGLKPYALACKPLTK